MATPTPMSLRLEVELRDRLERIAALKQRSSHSLAREALSRYIAEEERLAAWNASCEAAHNDFLETGLHLSHEQLDSWLDTWGTPNTKPAPECRE